jgi:amino acid permease
MMCVGLVVYLTDQAPIDPTFKWIIKVVAVIAAIVWLVSRSGVG